MADETDTGKLLAEAAERIRREAYAAGWHAAIQAVDKALDGVAEPQGIEGVGTAAGLSRATGVTANVTAGSTPWYVLQAIVKRPGMSGAEIVNTVREGGHDVPEGSIRTSIARLKKRKLITARHAKWFPA